MVFGKEIVCHTVTCMGCRAAETLANIHGSLADGGFLLLYETTAAFTTCLWGLDERTWKFTDEREYGLWMAKPRWHRLWTEAGFTQIVEHWCVSFVITYPFRYALISHQSSLINLELTVPISHFLLLQFPCLTGTLSLLSMARCSTSRNFGNHLETCT